MKLGELLNETFDTEDVIKLDDNEIVSESFLLTPLIAAITFKDDVLKKTEKGMDVITSPIDKAAGQVDRLKAKLEINSGKKPNDTVYKLTKEQKQVLSYIYKKYGKETLKEVQKFRTNIMAPYQVIKRSVANNKTLTDKEVKGMTKEEYDRYRESGAKKIAKLGTKFSDFKNTMKNYQLNSDEKKRIEEEIKKAENGGKINYAYIDKILEKTGYGIDTMNKWPPEELRSTFDKVVELEKDLSKANGNNVKLTVKNKKNKYSTAKQVRQDIEFLKEFGYSAYVGKPLVTGTRKGEFREAYNNYILRNKKRNEIAENEKEYRTYYLDALKDELKIIEKRKENSFDDVKNFSKGYDLNDYENKIWGVKPTGNKYSGDINDWYLKIKPEDFKGVKTFKKSDSTIKAEKEIDKQLKAFERKMKQTISEEDWKLLLKYRLVNNFITVKELKSGKDMFKSDKDIDKMTAADYNLDDFRSEIDELNNKVYPSLKDLEKDQKMIKNKLKAFYGKDNKDAKEYAEDFLNRYDTGNKENKNSSLDVEKITKLANKISSTEYTNEREASEDLRELDNEIDNFRNNYPDETAKLNAINYSIEKARSNVNAFINRSE